MANQVPETLIALIDNPHAPEVFAFRLAGAAVFAGNLHLAFAAPRVDHTTQLGLVNGVVIGRLVMPLAGVEDMVKFLTDYLEKIKSGQPGPLAPAPRSLN